MPYVNYRHSRRRRVASRKERDDQNNHEALLSTGETARRLNLSTDWVRQLARKGELPGIPTTNGYVFPVEAIAKYAEERRGVTNDTNGAT